MIHRNNKPMPLFDPVDPNVREQDRPRLSEQCVYVLEKLKAGPITERDVYPRVKRLAARIYDLRHEGYEIKDKWDGPVKRYWIDAA